MIWTPFSCSLLPPGSGLTICLCLSIAQQLNVPLSSPSWAGPGPSQLPGSPPMAVSMETGHKPRLSLFAISTILLFVIFCIFFVVIFIRILIRGRVTSLASEWVNLRKEEGRTGFSNSWNGCSEGFPEGKAQGKSQGAALPARGISQRAKTEGNLFLRFIFYLQ